MSQILLQNLSKVISRLLFMLKSKLFLLPNQLNFYFSFFAHKEKMIKSKTATRI